MSARAARHCPDAGLGPNAHSAPLGVWPSGYGLCAFVGWSEGAGTRPPHDTKGTIVDWKVLVELKDDYPTAFDAAVFTAFALRWRTRGFAATSRRPRIRRGRTRSASNTTT